MVKSIKHFEKESIMIFEKLEDEFFKNPQHIVLRGVFLLPVMMHLRQIKISMEER